MTNHSEPERFCKSLNYMPRDLEGTYGRILKDILKANPDQAYRLLQFLTVAMRPVSVDELAEVLAIGFSKTDAGMPVLKKDWRWDDKERGILAICSSLLVVVDSNDYNLGTKTRIVRFAHSSMKEFLTSDRLVEMKAGISRFYIRLEPAHVTTALSCLAILLQPDHDGRADGTSALYKYAARHWLSHVDAGNVSLSTYHGHLFDPAKPYFIAWLNSYDPDVEWTSFLRDDSESSPSWPQRSKFTSLGEDDAPLCLYYAALCGLSDLTYHLITKYPQHVGATVGLNKSPLVAALCKERIQVADLFRRRFSMHSYDLPTGYNGRTLLHAASADGLVNATEWLLDAGADVNARADGQRTPLYFAAMNGHLKLVEILLDRGAHVNAGATTDNHTPLHKASSDGQIDMVRLLLKRRANVRARDKSRSTPLHYVKNEKIIELLIKRGADVNAQDESQSTPLHCASSRVNAETVQALIKNGADVNARDESQSTPLHRVLSRKRDIISQLVIDHGENATAKTIQVLTKNGADVNARDQSQSTPLHLAASSWLVKITQLLLKHGADVHAANQDQSTPLHIASSLSFSMNMGTTVRLLIENGARVNAYDKNHQTPLHRVSSCWDPNSDCMRLLLENGADVDAEDNKGLTAFQIALSQENRHDKITQLLFDHRASMI